MDVFITRRGGGGGSGATLTVASTDAGTITVSNTILGKSYSKTVAAGDSTEFKGLASGTWTVTLNGDGQTATRTVTVTADYSVSISYFSATINITYPSGSTCTATDGVTSYSAPDTSGTWTLTVPNTGTWTLSCANGTDSDSESVEITAEGQSVNVELMYRLIIFDGTWHKGYQFEAISGHAPTIDNSANPVTLANPRGVGVGAIIAEIDVSKYSTLTMTTSVTGSNMSWFQRGLATNGDYSNNNASAAGMVAYTQSSGLYAEKTESLDISQLTGVHYFKMFWHSDGAATVSLFELKCE